ncbi:MAG: hypothetical protein KC422_23120, partial [Trueperaceae bacterium]|nr:hypothetical protein [Trueperaceae bacterium]
MNKTKTYKRYKFTVPEMSIIRGPATEANTGSGSYEDLRGTFWAWDWFDDTLSFYKWSGSEFAEVARPASFPELPKAANHIDAAFNTSARRVACYQEDETVSVIQWNNAETAFETVGPFTGVDPLLYNDVDFFEDPADSDTILFYLTTDRSALKARLERDQYGIEYDIVSFDLPGFLFQVARDDLALKFAIILEDGTVQYWTSGNYAIKASDTL